MQCLAPFEPREAGPPGAAATRLPWFVIAVSLSAALAGLLLMNWREVLDLLRRHTVLQAELAVCGGTLVGLFLSRMEAGPVMRRRLAMLDVLYERAATAAKRAEPGYTHYLPCVVLMADDAGANLTADIRSRSEAEILKSARSGVLYVGPNGLLLSSATAPPETRPDRAALGRLARRLAGRRAEAIVAGRQHLGGTLDLRATDLGSVRQVTAISVALPQSQFARLARARPHYAMLLRWSTGQALLAVPAIGDTLPRLHRCLDDLRWTSA